MTDETQQTLPQPPGGGSWIRQPDGSLTPNVPPAEDVNASDETASSKPKTKGR